ncbi:MAG: hypothetical protein A2758_01230 [Candidatus Zambryskibacteria bacterium RIFCSPHIGHO2_01_FULL_49_18]|uniref:Uncharacterized protein n=1 Tax=Candidatus Zambryskibacteria bacterium RIFCSPHIGHO2_01_FULL_49_18 TaxID=1802740 RepID=A0A1G2T3L4_9BACT|nr:MAG: hypothetical protein A2758_01230 [Candidatus Zambryskibacteria bacterium RIFCSPHIGHO2_01_FULL_49_18]
MIDTIVISLPMEKVRTLDLIASGVERWDMQSRTKAHEKYVKNPSLRDKASGLYFPTLTVHNRKVGPVWVRTMDIQVSTPKLLYKNNLDELIESYFERVIEALADRLLLLGVVVAPQHLREAVVRAVHYSKNFELGGGYTAQYIIRELGKINPNKHFDFARARFVNDGENLYLHTRAHEFVLYDKVADLAKDEKRAMDRDPTPYQQALFESLNRQKEILRLEVRLCQKRKMNSVFKELGFAENPTFREVFSLEKSQKVLNHYWDTMIAGQSAALFVPSPTPKDLLNQVLIARQDAKGKTAVYLAALLLFARYGNGLRELRSILAKRIDDRTWYRIAADLHGIAADLGNVRPRDWYDQMQKGLSTYQPIHIDRS